MKIKVAHRQRTEMGMNKMEKGMEMRRREGVGEGEGEEVGDESERDGLGCGGAGGESTDGRENNTIIVHSRLRLYLQIVCCMLTCLQNQLNIPLHGINIPLHGIIYVPKVDESVRRSELMGDGLPADTAEWREDRARMLTSVSTEYWTQAWLSMRNLNLETKLATMTTPVLMLAGAADGLLNANIADVGDNSVPIAFPSTVQNVA